MRIWVKDWENLVPVSQYVWHNIDPSLFKGAEHRHSFYILLVKSFGVGTEIVNVITLCEAEL
jgi:hypothetical protein